MLLDGHVVAITTGLDIDAMKVKLFYGYFHLPEPSNKPRKKKRRA